MCGIFGIFDHEEAANIIYLGLYSLQHRGQEACGIATFDSKMNVVKKPGYVVDGFKKEALSTLKGKAGIGHVRYSTSGGSNFGNTQPFVIDHRYGELALAHNGNLLYKDRWRKLLEEDGAIFQTKSDTEIILHLMSRSKETDFVQRIVDSLKQVKGAYSLLFLNDEKLIAVRDPHGFRPLVMGELNGSIVFSSENCAFSLIGAKFIRSLEPGEVVVVDKEGVKSLFPFEKAELFSRCIFEHVYFARPDSNLYNSSIYENRIKMGRTLAKEHPVEADLVIPVPDSGIAAAIGYAKESNIEFAIGLIRSHYVGRTFIEPNQSIRSFGVKLKLSPSKDILKGKKVIVVDDSLVRGTTSRKIMKMLKDAGAKEIHLRIGSPPVAFPCFYGIDTPTKEELIASNKSIKEITDYVCADSLGYLTIKGLLNSMLCENPNENFCTACFDGNYPQDPYDTNH
jgi:amidophosphoribosyltransferase